MTLAVSALAALALLLIYDGLTSPPGRRTPKLSLWLDELLAEAGVRAAPSHLLSAVAISTLLTFFIVAGMTRSMTTAIALSGVSASLPFSVLRSRRRSRRRRFAEAWPDALGNLIASVRAGISLPEGLSNLVARGPDELKSGFAAFQSTYRATGSFPAGLKRLRSEFADPIADRVIVSLELAHDVGGTDLVRLLRATADFVREDLRVRKEIEARWSWTVVAARVAAGAPWIVLLLMALRPEAARAYDSATGIAVIGFGGLATLVGYRLMLRAGRLPEERRLA